MVAMAMPYTTYGYEHLKHGTGIVNSIESWASHTVDTIMVKNIDN